MSFGDCAPYVIAASVALSCLSAWQEDPSSLSVRAAASGFLLRSADSHTIEPTEQVLEKSSCHTSMLHISIADKNNWRSISSFSLHLWGHRAWISQGLQPVHPCAPLAPIHLRYGTERPSNQPALVLICLQWNCCRDPQWRFQPFIVISQGRWLWVSCFNSW